MVSTLPSPLALALRSDHMCAFALEMFIEDDDNIPGNPFRGINHQAKCMPVLLCCRGVLVALHRIVSNSGKFFYESCLWGGILLCASQLLLKAKSQPWFTLALYSAGCCFLGVVAKLPKLSVSRVGFGPVSGTEPSWQLWVQLSCRFDDRLLTEVKASWVFYFCEQFWLIFP